MGLEDLYWDIYSLAHIETWKWIYDLIIYRKGYMLDIIDEPIIIFSSFPIFNLVKVGLIRALLIILGSMV